MVWFQDKNKMSVYDSFSPILYISGIAGVCPIKRDVSLPQFVTSYPFFIFEIVILVINILHLLAIPQAIIHVEKESQVMSATTNNVTDTTLTSQHFITKMLNPLLMSFCSAVVRFSNLSQMRKKLPKLFEKIHTFDRLNKTESIIIIRKEKRTIKYMLVVIFTICWPFQIYSVFEEISRRWQGMAIFIFNVYNAFATTCVEFQFSCICMMLLKRFEKLHEQIKLLENINDPQFEEVTALFPVRKYIEVNNSSKVANRKTLNKIRSLQSSYRILSECCVQLNHAYNLQILVTIIISELNVLLSVYFAIFGGYSRPSTVEYAEHQPVWSSVQCVIWAAFFFIRIVWICFSAGFLIKESNLTKIIISHLLSRRFEKLVKEQVWSFYACAVANKIRFTACGFFKIDFFLISAAITTGTTYLVILAQFHNV